MNVFLVLTTVLCFLVLMFELIVILGLDGRFGIAELRGGTVVRQQTQCEGKNDVWLNLRAREPLQMYLLSLPGFQPAQWLERDFQKTRARVLLSHNGVHSACEVWKRRAVVSLRPSSFP